MKVNSLLFKKTSTYQALINSQNRAPVFFLNQLNKLGLLPTIKSISKDLDFNEKTYLVTSIDVRALSKARLDFLVGTLNSVKFKETGLVKASISSVFSLRGKLQANAHGLAGFDGSPLLILTYSTYVQALRAFPELSREDFADDEEVKEWAVLVHSLLPLFVSFRGYLFPFDFFKSKFEGLSCSSQHLSSYLVYRTSANISSIFGSSISKFSRACTLSARAPLVTSAAASSILKKIFLSFITYRTCQL